MGPSRRLVWLAFVAVLLTFTWAGPAQADLIGVRAGFYTKAEEPFVGAELLLPVGHGHDIFLNPNVEYVFVERATFITFNLDAHVDLPTHGRGFVWVGGGLAVLYANPDGPAGSDTDVGANILAGVGLKGDVIPYVQAKLILKSDTEFVIGFGLRF